MKLKYKLLAIAVSFFLMCNFALAKPDKDKPKKHIKVPEISLESGKSALILLSGILLLAGERVRSRRS